ncbi:hypothetical protein NQ314_020075 [Rhamnusium bicolor]|uniref:VPS37 C-terminal domain-containing protein n=1 Tax=Rhamnusium bicolor TaxID=1586634 RepID=A0AAV8WM43_9CUCU|nr:hypothetical protein NQ314_020075 [Rhamnusium bicolor]
MLPRQFKTEADIRKHQINTLKIFNDNVAELSEGEEYEICFNSGGNNLYLNVSLSQEFPNEKPMLKVVPAIIHHWVNSDGQITSAPGLLNFTVHSDLGRVVQAIIREFQRTPPPLVSNHSSSVVSPTIPILVKKRASPINYQSFSNIKNFSPPSHMSQTSFLQKSSAFPELSQLSLAELQLLNDNIDSQEEFIDELPQVKEQYKFLGDLIEQVEELAESNLSKQGKLEELREGIDSRIEAATKLAFENERLHVIYQNLSDKFSPRNIREQLKLAAAKADLDSEKVAESFLNGEIDVDKFVSDFIKTKTLCQTRKTKEEKTLTSAR